MLDHLAYQMMAIAAQVSGGDMDDAFDHVVEHLLTVVPEVTENIVHVVLH